MGWYEFLPKLLNMSMTASLIILAVLVVRLLLKKAPKMFSYALWAVVLFRLLCPVSVASDFSLLGIFQVPVENGAAEYIPVNIVHTENPQVTLPDLNLSLKEEASKEQPAGLPVGDTQTSQVVQAEEQPQSAGTGEEGSATGIGLSPIEKLETAINKRLPQGSEQLAADPLEAPVTIATYIWGLGVLILVFYNIVQLWRLREKLEVAEPLKDNIYLADHIDTAFVMGLVRPRIYLPSGLKEQERSYIILHEQYHIRRGDHVVKVLAFAAFCIHWFNPLVWLAFLLATKDMEMSCDEAVMKQMGQDIRAEYASSLLQFATGKRLIAGAPLAFGEGDTKARVKNIMHYKKPAFWLVLVAVIVCIVVAVCLMTNPKEKLTTPFGKTYRVIQTYFYNQQCDETIYTDTSADYRFSETGELLYKWNIWNQEFREWIYLGNMVEVSLTQNNFDEYFYNEVSEVKFPDRKMLAQELRERNVKAWTFVAPSGTIDLSYYLLQQENGEIYLAGWHNDEIKGIALSEDDSYVEWVVKLEEIDENVAEKQSAQEEITYHSKDCLYMNPASSYAAFNGDSGFLYRMEEDAFVKMNKNGGGETRMEVEEWTWQKFPYTDEEWAALYWPFDVETKISEIYEEMLYMPLDNRDCLMKMDEQLWLVTIANESKRDLSYLWSIYVLAPVDGSATEVNLPIKDSSIGKEENGTEQDTLEEGASEIGTGQDGEVEIPPTSYDLTVGTTYRTSEWVEWSIFTPMAPLNGDSGYLYELTEQEFIIRNKTYGSEERIPVAQWGWQELPYTDEEWSAIAMSSRFENIRSDYTEVLYQPISEDWFILRVDGVLFLVEMIEVREQEELGEVFTLVPEGQKAETHFVKKEYERYYEECPEGVYSVEEWLDEEGGLTTPFNWTERGEMSLAENRVGYYIPRQAMEQVGTAELLTTVVEWRHFGSYNDFNFLGDYFNIVTGRFNAMEEVLKRPDLAKALFAEYKTDIFPIIRTFGNEEDQKAYDRESWFFIEKIATQEALLASNLAFDQMDEAMKQEVLTEALKKVEQRQSGRFQCGYKSADGEIVLSEFPSGFFAYILEQEERSGSKWYRYLVETGETELVEKLDGLSVRECWP